MPLYDYRCRVCGTTTELFYDMSRVPQVVTCLSCGNSANKTFSFSFLRPMPAHYNPSLGQHISNTRDLNSALSRASDETSERLGHESRFIPIDMRDRRSLGVTSEGLDKTHDALMAAGRTDDAHRLSRLLKDD